MRRKGEEDKKALNKRQRKRKRRRRRRKEATMIRSSSGSSKKSFLDELLGNDLEKSESSKRSKSVRFIDDDEDNDILGKVVPSSASGRAGSAPGNSTARPGERVSPFDSLDWTGNSLGSTPRKPSSPTADPKPGKSTRASDWLGLNEDKEPQSLPTPLPRGSSGHAQNSTAPEDDWLSAGLSSRRSREKEPQSPGTPNPSKSEDSSWLNIKKRMEVSKQQEPEPEPDFDPTPRTEPGPRPGTVRPQPKVIEETGHQQAVVTNPLPPSVAPQPPPLYFPIGSLPSDPSVLMLQTQVKMLELEKAHLSQTLEQLKKNREEEMKIMKDLHEQQLRMSTDFLRQQETMVREEKERRINELKNQLEESGKEREEMRLKYNQRVDSTQSEWHQEVERLKEMHNNTVKRLNDQHEQDIERIRKIKEQEIGAIEALQSHGTSLQDLLSKWEKSAQQIESLHINVISKQEEMLREKVSNVEHKDQKLDHLESNWNLLARELDKERERYRDAQRSLSEVIESQRTVVSSTQSVMIAERQDLVEERRRFEEDKRRLETEAKHDREALDKEREAFHEDVMRFGKDRNALEMREKQQHLQGTEWKQQFQKEREEINTFIGDIEERRKDLHREKSQLQQALLSLQSEQQRFEQRKVLFDSEKVKLLELASQVAARAEELEAFSNTTYSDREQGLAAMEAAEHLKADLDIKMEFMEKKALEIRRDDERVQRESRRLEAEWSSLADAKDSLVCSLCSSSLNKVKTRCQGLPTFPVYQNNGIPSGLEGTENGLFVWQMTAQQDAALLAEETAFVRTLQRAAGIGTSKDAFQRK